jgi:DNA-binding NtrC family response regulator
MIPPKDKIVICFAHAAYQMKACFDALNTGIHSFEVRERDEFERRAPEADVIVVSGLDPKTNRRRAISGGAMAFVQKPWDQENLLAIIGQLLGSPELSPSQPK